MLASWQRIERAIEGRDWARALALLLDRWRTTPDPVLAGLIERIDRKLDQVRPPLDALPTIWDAAAQQADPGDLTRLMRVLPKLGWRDATTRLQQGVLADWPPDPRLASLLRELLVHPTLPRGTGTFDLWHVVISRLETMDDPRTTAALPALRDHQRHFPGDGTVWISNALIRLSRKLDGRTYDSLPQAEEAVCQSLSAALMGSQGTLTDARALHAAVFENPNDLSIRAVLGDVLLRLDDPLGEFIQLQLASSSPKSRKRQTTLLKQHGAAWTAPISPALQSSARRFEGGFLAAAKVRGVSPLQAYVGKETWATVHTLDVSGWQNAPPEIVNALLTHPVMRALNHVRGLSVQMLPTTPQRWTHLGVLGPLRQADLTALSDCITLEHLYALDLGDLRRLEPLACPWHSPLFQRLKRVAGVTHYPIRWLPHLLALPEIKHISLQGDYRLQLAESTLFYQWDWTLERDLLAHKEPVFSRIMELFADVDKVDISPRLKTPKSADVEAYIRGVVEKHAPEATLTLRSK